MSTTDPFVLRQKQVLAKVETTAGTAETLTASNGGIRVQTAAAIELDQPVQPRDIARSTLTNLGALPGEKAGTITLRTEANTPDSITATAMETTQYFQACGMTVLDLYAISIGTVSGGPYTRGETVTDASGYQGLVTIAAADGDDFLYYEQVTTTLSASEVLTGASSGATATSGPTGAATAGYRVKPISNSQKTVTIALQEDGYEWKLAGAMGNLVGTFEASRAGYFEFAMTGPKESYGDVAMTTGISYQTEQPPILQGAELTINSQTVVFKSCTLDMGNTVVNRIDGNAGTTGYIAAYISQREPKLTVSYEHIEASTLDTYGQLASGTKIPVKFHVGTAVGKKIWVFADLAQVTGISIGEQDGIRTVDVEYTLTGAAAKSEDELEMVFQ